jgi:DNA-binding NtrC family response regulator
MRAKGHSLATTEQISGGLPLSVPLQKIRVTVTEGPDRGRVLELGDRHQLIGRSEACDLQLTDPTVSSMHLEIALAEDGVLVRNLGSRNGVQVGVARVEEAVVEVPTAILLGRTVLGLQPTDDQTLRPLAAVQRIGGLVGRSLKMKLVFGLIQQFAGSEATVLIEGATGTGKELAARAIHDRSPRASGPYEIIDCGAIPAHLMEAELFGCARGAYTGADTARAGVFERASGGTVVLDEVGELPLELQPKLLGVIERGVVKRLGEQQPRKVSVRVIATTNRVLAREVQAQRFRQDLYFRLTVLRLALPPLRDRREDVSLLAADILGSSFPLPAAWMRVLERHDWPGNVRELRNVLERARARAGQRPGDVALDLSLDDGRPLDALEDARRTFEREYLTTLLHRAGDNVRRAAKLAGITRQGLYALLARHGLRNGASEDAE